MRVHRENANWSIVVIGVRITAYLLAILLVCGLFHQLRGVDIVRVYAQEPGVTDLTDFDFTASVAYIGNEDTENVYMYPGKFYTTEEFAAGAVSLEDGILYDRTPGAQGEYGTLRVLPKLPPGQVYAISGKNASYAQRLFIDGRQCASIGEPGETLETTLPKTTQYMVAFQPTEEITEFIVHYAAFAYADGGGVYPWNVGQVDNVARALQFKTFQTVTVTAALTMALLFFLGLYMLFPKNRALLWFGLCCGLIGLRGLFLWDKVIMVLLPNLDWYLAIRLEFEITIAIALVSGLYLYSLFPGKARRSMMWAGTAWCLSCMLYICFSPPHIFSLYVDRLVWMSAAYVVCLLAAVLIAALQRKLISPLSAPEQVLLLTGLVLYAILSLMGIRAHQLIQAHFFGMEHSQLGMIIFLFFNITALVLGFSRTERERDAARISEQDIRETNQMLERLDRAKTEFLAGISHEMKTPLAVMSNCAGLTLAQLQANATNEESKENLDTIQQEAVRLGRLVEHLMQILMEKERQLTFAFTDTQVILHRAAEYCHPICQGRGNKVAVLPSVEHIPLYLDADRMFQVLINLITNANRQTRGKTISLSAVRDETAAIFTVADEGRGVAPDLLSHVFQRGVSDGGSAGLGLAICKEIVEEHGGSIAIENTDTGAKVCFTLPIKGEDRTYDGSHNSDD